MMGAWLAFLIRWSAIRHSRLSQRSALVEEALADWLAAGLLRCLLSALSSDVHEQRCTVPRAGERALANLLP